MQLNTEKRFFIHTLGCKVNQYESQAMRELLVAAGFKECPSKHMADIYIINTCTVTERADKESRHWISFFHKTNPNAKIVVAGCYPEMDADSISFLPGIAHIVKNSEKNRIAEIINEQRTTNDERRDHKRPSLLSITGFKGHSKAFVKIQDGCENFCSYCKVPLVRGPLRSKPIDDIKEEVKTLVDGGFKEIILTGICLGAWGKDLFPEGLANGSGLDNVNLVDVLEALDRMPGEFRVRLSSIEPKHVTPRFIDFLSQSKRICRHLHIPLQSGDDEVLKRMNRPYSAAEYRQLIDGIRNKVKDIAITTDLLTGFPGESDAGFERTLNFVKDILPARVHIFTFSKRRGTAAYDMAPDVPRDVLKKRFLALKVAAFETSYIYRARFLNEKLDVLVETGRDRYSGLLTGYTDNYIKVLFKGPDELMKKIAPVRIEDMTLLLTLGAYDEK